MKFVLIAMLSAMRFNTAPQVVAATFDDIDACRNAGAAFEKLAERMPAGSLKAQWECLPAASERK